MLRKPASILVLAPAGWLGGLSLVAARSLCLGGLLGGSSPAFSIPPAYPTAAKPYEVIVFEQPGYVGSYRMYIVAPGLCLGQARKLDAFKNNIRSVLVGAKVGAAFYVEEDFRGRHATTFSSLSNLEQLPREEAQSIRVEHKIKSLVVFLKEPSGLQGATLSANNGEAQFFPASASGKGMAAYPQIALNDKASALQLTLARDAPGQPWRPSLSVELFEHKDFKGDWIRLPGAVNASTSASFLLSDYAFAKKVSSLRVSYLQPVPVRPEQEPEAPEAKPLPVLAQPPRPLLPASPAQPLEPPRPMAPARPLGPVTLPELQDPVGAADSLRFDPSSLAIAPAKGGWAIVDRGDPRQIAIARFKQDRKGDAERALQVLQHFGINQKEVLGDSGFALFLVSGKAPEGEFPGEKCQTFDPQNLLVEHRSMTSKNDPTQVTGSYWAIMHGPQQLWAFQDDEQRAREARMFIRQYGFTRLCGIGGFYYWRK